MDGTLGIYEDDKSSGHPESGRQAEEDRACADCCSFSLRPCGGCRLLGRRCFGRGGEHHCRVRGLAFSWTCATRLILDLNVEYFLLSRRYIDGGMSNNSRIIPSRDCEDCRSFAEWIQRDHPDVEVLALGAPGRRRAANARLCDRCHCRGQADDGINEWIAATQGSALWVTGV